MLHARVCVATGGGDVCVPVELKFRVSLAVGESIPRHVLPAPLLPCREEPDGETGMLTGMAVNIPVSPSGSSRLGRNGRW